MAYIIYQEKEQIAEAVAAKLMMFSASATEKVDIALSGGSTPKDIFRYICDIDQRYMINWEKLHFWWVDERCVAFSSDESNFGKAKRLLFDHVDIPEANLHPISRAASPEQSTIAYVQEIKRHVPLSGGVPCFDWIWLGMGEDGHTASLFVNGLALDSARWVDVAEHPQTGQLRITFNLKVINHASVVDFLVAGENKAAMVCKILCEQKVSLEYPAKYVKPEAGALTWHLDQAAALKLREIV